MLRRLRSHLTPALVMSVIALVAATSGTAIAESVAKIARNTIGSAQVKDGSLRLKDVNKRDRAKLRGKRGPAGPAGPAGQSSVSSLDTANLLTKTEAETKYLAKTGKAADSEKLDGLDSTGYMKGRGSIGFNRRVQASAPVPGAPWVTVLGVPGLGEVQGRCTNPFIAPDNQAARVRFLNESGATLDAVMDDGDPAAFASLAESATQFASPAIGDNAARRVTWQVGRGNGSLIGGTDVATIVVTAISHPGGASSCRFQAQAIQQDRPGLVLMPIEVSP